MPCLDKVFPYWFYFLTRNTGSLLMVALSICRYVKRPDRMVAPDREDLEAFMTEVTRPRTLRFRT